MDAVALLRGLPGSFHFLHPSEAELRRLLGASGVAIPPPQPVFLEGERPTGLRGYLVRESPDSASLEQALHRGIAELETAVVDNRDLDALAEASPDWQEYERLLGVACENVTASDYGRHYPAIFWLDHSNHIARLIRTVPQRLAALTPNSVAAEISRMRFGILECLMRRIDGVLETVRERVAQRVDGDGELYPQLFRCMRDNVLIFSETSVEGALFGIDGFLLHHCGIDADDFRARWFALVAWHGRRLTAEPGHRSLSGLLTGILDGASTEHLLTVPGYVAFLHATAEWDEERLWSARQVEAWEQLLPRLKVFELLDGLRRLTIRVRRVGDRLVCPRAEVERMDAGNDDLYLSPTLRPVDFTTPWVVDPGVARTGLVYDVIHFTGILSSLREQGAAAEEAAFRTFFQLQRRLDRIAETHRLYREKYLGDGVFYTGRDSRRLLVAAICMQRAYRQAVTRGFPFERGLRLALNHGSYRLLPFGGPTERSGGRYEIFGETVVELFRLISGKSGHDLHELRRLLISRGYEETEVDRFFAPLTQGGEATAGEPVPPFGVHLSPAGRLINHGIVATQAVLDDLEATSPIESFRIATAGARRYALVVLEDAGVLVEIGIRVLGRADLKGLVSPLLLEIVDLAAVEGAEVSLPECGDLAAAFRRIDAPSAVAHPGGGGC